MIAKDGYAVEKETIYWIWLAGSLLLCSGLFTALELKPAKGTPSRFLLCAGVTGFFGLLCARLSYYLCQIDFMIAEGWLRSLLSLSPEGLSFYGGASGVCLGIALLARAWGMRPLEALDRYAPFGLLLGALARFGEYFLDMRGIGPWLENESLCFFPLAMGYSYGNDWTEWYLAVFMLEGLSLLIVAAVSRWRFQEHRFWRSLFWMCLPQILLENLRMDSMMWFFCIRVAQLACMITMFVILILYGRRSSGQSRRFVPAGVALGCAGLFILCEFAMEGKIPFLRFLSIPACYGLMFLGQAVLGWMEILAFHRIRRMELNNGIKRTEQTT